MGTKGRNKQTAIMGSVTEKIILRESCPVLAIPEDYVFVGKQNLKCKNKPHNPQETWVHTNVIEQVEFICSNIKAIKRHHKDENIEKCGHKDFIIVNTISEEKLFKGLHR